MREIRPSFEHFFLFSWPLKRIKAKSLKGALDFFQQVGEVGFCKAPWGNLVFLKVACVSPSCAIKFELKTIITFSLLSIVRSTIYTYRFSVCLGSDVGAGFGVWPKYHVVQFSNARWFGGNYSVRCTLMRMSKA